MKNTFVFLLGCVLALPLCAYQVQNSFLKPDSMKGWSYSKNQCELTKEGLKVTANGTVLLRYYLPVDQIRSKRVTVEVEVKGYITKPPKYSGGRFGIIFRDSKNKAYYPGTAFPTGKFDWKKLKFSVNIPDDVVTANIEFGADKAEGTFYYRHLKLIADDTMLNIAPAMNMEFRDDKENDGKGGWSDQGPNNDARGIPIRKEYKGIPFNVLYPYENKGKTIVLFQSSRFPKGVKEFTIDLSKGHSVGPYLYLLHTMTWGDKDFTVIGIIEVTSKTGKARSFQVRINQDINGWWTPKRISNAVPLVTWSNKSCSYVGVSASLFELEKNFGEVATVKFHGNVTNGNWHLLAATLTPKLYEYPADEHIVIKEGSEWRQMPKTPDNDIVPGSALDLSSQLPWKSVDETGRLVVNKKGEVEFEKFPGKPVRFLTAEGIPSTDAWSNSDCMKTHAEIEAHCLSLRRQGYNMIRLASPDYYLMILREDATKDFEFSKKYLDRLDYLIYCMKKYGIYLNLGCMSGWGWHAGNPWDGKPKAPIRNYPFTMYFTKEARAHWEKGFMQLITRVNPYTKTRLIDDPVMAICLCFNEQESAFFKGQNVKSLQFARPAWIKYLKKAYNNDFNKLKKAWGDVPANIKSFDDLPVFSSGDMISYGTRRGKDFVLFSIEAERETRDFYINTLRKNGVKSMISSANMGLDFRYILLRSKYDCVTINGYHSHPSGESLLAGSAQNDPASAIERSGRHMRGFASLRNYGKPIFNTEHGMVFWNGYRYEQGFLVGAYAALQDFSGLTVFSGPVQKLQNNKPLRPFVIHKDPVGKATEFITACAFARGDVRTADPMIRLCVDDSMMSAKNVDQDGINSEQQKLAFVTRISSDVDQNSPLQKNEMKVRAVGGSKVVLHQGGMFQNAQDADPTSYKSDKLIVQLKKFGMLPKNNKTDISKGIFESSTGEIFMNTEKKFMSVDTPRLQGFCLLAGEKGYTRDLSVNSITERGTVAVTSVDEKTSIRDAKRLVFIYATNALNSDMEFATANHAIRLKLGHWPVLLKTGTVNFSLRNNHAEKLHLYALRFNGSRMEEIPLKRSKNEVMATIDTAKLKEGVPFFFELVVK